MEASDGPYRAGELPFSGNTLGGVFASVLEETPAPLDRQNLKSPVPPALARVVEKCLRKDARRRAIVLMRKLLMRRLLLLLILLLPACAGLRIQSASKEVSIARDIPYVTRSEDPFQQLDLYVPRTGTSFPVVLFVHGGFWRAQDRRYYESFTGLYGNVGVSLARRGFAVAVQSYRLSPRVGIHEQVDDVVSALRWVEENIASYGGDPTRVVLVGYSAGGHLVSLVGLNKAVLASAGLDASRVRGVVSISGILDVPEMARGQDAAFNEDVTYRLFGRTSETQAMLSPSTYLRADAPPLLALAAEHDYPFVLSAAREVTAHLSSLGARATFVELKGHDHADMVLNINSSSDVLSDPLAQFAHSVTDAR